MRKLEFWNFIRQAANLYGFMFVFMPVVAQTITLPSKLSGRWTTVEGTSGQVISANIDAATSKGTLTVWSQTSACTIHDAPITVTSTGEKLLLKVDPSYTNPCRSNVSVELTRMADSNDFEGELRQGGLAGARYPVLRVKMSP